VTEVAILVQKVQLIEKDSRTEKQRWDWTSKAISAWWM